MMKKIERALALLLCAALCLGLLPAAYAEEIEAVDPETAISAVEETDEPDLEVIEEADAEEEVEAPAEIQSISAAAELSDPEDAAQEDGEEIEQLPEPVLVRFLTDEEELLAFLTLADADGVYQEPYTDPSTGAACFGLYLLMPGEYVWRFHDDSDRYCDMEERFTVEECEQQFLRLDPEPSFELYTFSFTYINPIYEGIITEEDIPEPSLSEEELAADVREIVSILEGGSRGTDAKFMRNSGLLNTTVEAAGLELRDQIMEFEDEATILLACQEEPDSAMWNSLAAQVIAVAFAHTGVPTEGDYLRYEYGGYSVKGAIGIKEGIHYCKFIFALQHFTNAAQEAELDQLADSILDSLSLEGKNNYEKIFAIYRYLCDTVKGSGSGNLKYTAYGALVQKGALCQGISSAFYRLCLAAGVDTRVVTSAKMSHAWNIVNLGGRYYILDATNDYGRTFENYRFFLAGRTTWCKYNELGDQFNDESFAAAYSVPEYDYSALITKQPENCTVFAGRDVNLAVEATGGELVYRWETRANENEAWQEISGANAASFTKTALLTDNGRLYRCKVSNSAGFVYSETAATIVKNYVYNISLNLAEKIGINLYIGGADSYEGLTVTWTKKDGTAVTKKVTDGIRSSDNQYIFALDTVASKEMTREVPVVVKDAKGNKLLEASCSVKSYCEQVFKKDERYAPLKDLCQATLDYGSFAQIYFGYQTDNLANPAVSAEALPTVSDEHKASVNASCTGISGASISLALDYQTAINFYFFPESSAYSADQYTVTAEDADGNPVAARISTQSDGPIILTISGIAAKKLGDKYSVKIHNKADGSELTVTASALSYAWIMQNAEENIANTCKALYNYYLKAKAFF